MCGWWGGTGCTASPLWPAPRPPPPPFHFRPNHLPAKSDWPESRKVRSSKWNKSFSWFFICQFSHPKKVDQSPVSQFSFFCFWCFSCSHCSQLGELKCFVNEFCFGQGRGHSISDLSSDARKKKQNRNETSKSVSSFIGKQFGSLFASCFCTTQSLDRMKFQNFFFNLHVPACLSVKVKDKTDLFFKLQFSHTI